MRKMLTMLFAALLVFFTGCEYDDTALTDRVENLEGRVEKLEELCNQMNANIDALQSLVEALENKDYVTAVTPVVENGKEIGYTISFSKSKDITIYHGQDGKDGQNGQDGVDGKDGYTPEIGVKRDTDGIYYWTLDGEWLLDVLGNKIKAEGQDGKDGIDGQDGQDGVDGQNGQNGADGQDAVAPKLKIENGYWWISYDGGMNWIMLDKAVGEDGQDGADGQNGVDGQDGDSFFESVDTSDPDFVVFTLANGTTIKIPTWYAFSELQKICQEMNENISALQTIVDAMQNSNFIQSVEPLKEDGQEVGYTIRFSNGESINIYNGKNGADGQDGQNGQNGSGHTPAIGVQLDVDGVYYWTVDGEWLLDNEGNKVQAQGVNGKDGADGQDGQDGENGKDAVTPILKIEDGYWKISYDNGLEWETLSKAVGEDGQNGQDGADGKDGDSFFQDVDTSDPAFVIFTLADGSRFKVPTWYSLERLMTICNQMNTNIDAMQTIIDALLNKDYVEKVETIYENGRFIGYSIFFTKSGEIRIYNGQDGHTPVIGVKADTDGVYYWTLDGEWLLDAEGQKVKAEGRNGNDAIAPQLKIEGGYWWISNDNGASWKKLSKAVGENGKDGDSFFKDVKVTKENVEFILSDGTSFTIPLASDNLFNRLQSITYIPEYTDGKTAVQNKGGVGVFNFRISPKDVVADLLKDDTWKTAVSMHAYYTKERTVTAVSFVDMPVEKFEANDDMITVTVSGKNLSAEFFAGTRNASAELLISDGNITVSSERIQLLPVEKPAEIVKTPKILTLGHYEGGADPSIGAWDGFNLQNAPVVFAYAHSGTQSMYLPEQLTDMKGQEITSMSFKAYCESYQDPYLSSAKLYLTEIDGRKFPYNEKKKSYEWVNFDESNVIATAEISDLLSYYYDDIEVTFTFDKPYEYTGKTLIVTIVADADECVDPSNGYLAFYWIDSVKGDPYKSMVFASDSEDFFTNLSKNNLVGNDNEDKWFNAPAVQFGYNKLEYR